MVDAESGAGISGASVTLFTTHENRVGTVHSVTENRGETDSDGRVLLTSPSPRGALALQVAAKGFLPANATRVTTATAQVGLYREPAAGITIVVPQGYRGKVQIEISFADEAPRGAIPRMTSHELRPGQPIRVKIPAPLLSLAPESYQAVYADGSTIPLSTNSRRLPDNTICWRAVASKRDRLGSGHKMTFVVGSYTDELSARQMK